MLNFIKRTGIAILLGLVVQPGQAAQADIVDGFTEFLVDRANANLLAVFERRLKDDGNFQCYFPNTHAKIEKLRLEDLFASKSYWEDSLAVDLETLIYRSLLVEAQQGLKILDRNAVIETLQLFDYEYEGKLYPMNVIELDWPRPLKDQVNGFSNNLADALEKIESQRIYEDVCQVTARDKAELKRLLQPYLDAAPDLEAFADHLASYGKNLRFNEAGKRAFLCKLHGKEGELCAQAKFADSELSAIAENKDDPEIYRKAARIARRLDRAFGDLDAREHLGNAEKMTIERAAEQLPLLEEKDASASLDIERMRKDLERAKNETRDESRKALVDVLAEIKARIRSVDDSDYKRISSKLQAIIDSENSYTDRALVALDLLESSNQFGEAEMERLRRSVMFFVSIADAEDKDAVKAILEAYTLPAVSYTEKRKQGYGFFISSYLGMAANLDTDLHGSQQEASNGGMFVPVGLEYNYGRAGGDSLSIMLSPVDMAYPVNLKLKGIEKDVEFDELIAPSLSLAYGFEDWPVNVGIAYQRGRRLADVGKSEEKWLLFFTFDMPLLRLY